MRTSESGHWCGGSEVRIMASAGLSCGLLNQSHTRINKLLVSLRFRSSQTRTPHNDANFGIGTLVRWILHSLQCCGGCSWRMSNPKLHYKHKFASGPLILTFAKVPLPKRDANVRIGPLVW